ncbi:MAG: SH3 domain-containing protein [Treponema sp.]|jgi:hypothetical protein|nr:SH3 domain-containing protein [Treponema sp.]
MQGGQKNLLHDIFIILSRAAFCAVLCAPLCALAACSSRLGWGVLLWSIEEPSIPSGTVMPVYIKSNINKVWVVGLPDGWYGGKGAINKIEIPFSHFELAGSKRKANMRAREFSRYALVYAENLQDGLPIRDNPDNNARRIYRLKTGEIIKILSAAEGSPAIGSTGEPLPGEWFKVLTEDGSTGYCFSYRLKLFEHSGGQLAASRVIVNEKAEDPDLDMLLSKTWSPESYLTMVNSKRINLEDMSRQWRFDPGQETGLARIFVSGIDNSYAYNSIRPDGNRVWRFEGTNLSMQLRSDTTLAVQFSEGSGGIRTLLFVSLPVSVDDLILQETARRERLYNEIYSQGPVFTSNNYGTITFMEGSLSVGGSPPAGGGTFTWQKFDLLIPQFIPENTEGNGTILIDLFLDAAFEGRYDGAFTLRFTNSRTALHCMYSLDNEGFRIEIVPDSSIEDSTIVRRGASPMVLYFFRDTGLW